MRWYVKQMFHLVAVLQHDREATIGFVRWLRDHAFDHFFLQHEYLHVNVWRELREVKQQRAGDVVRQIAHDFTLCLARGINAEKIKLQRIGTVDGQTLG